MKEPKGVTTEEKEKEKAIYIAGVYEGMNRLANTMGGDAGRRAGSLISTAYYNFLKEKG